MSRLRLAVCALAVGVCAAPLAGEMKFARHEIGRAGNKMGQTSLGDVDRDGDIDICSKPWNGDLHVYLENLSEKANRK